MAERPVNPIIPIINLPREAAAASSSAIFSAADRKIIEERTGGENLRTRGFLDVLKDKPLLPEVENQETTVQEPQKDAKAIESRFDQHRKMLKHSPITLRKDQVVISGSLPDTFTEEEPFLLGEEEKGGEEKKDDKADTQQASKEKKEALALANELKLKPSELFDKFNLEQKELFSLVSRLRAMHLRRLLSESRLEFEQLSSEIKRISLSAAKPAEKEWLENQFNRLTMEAAVYKLGVMRSLQQIEFNDDREKDLRWLEDEVRKLS